MRRLVLLALVLAACGRPPGQPNVLLVTIDTLRPDHVGRGTPALDAFLSTATRFTRARTVTPLTLPAHTSMFTGLFPASHGIHDNVTPPLPAPAERSFPLLAEQFREAGYSTAAFVARPVLAPATGIASGFDLFDCPGAEEERIDTGGYVPGDERVRAPIAWIEKPPAGKPWFMWVHLFDPHAPYRAFPGDALRAPTRDTDPPDVRYAGEVRRADAALERLLGAIGEDTIVVVCSDHGEGLGDHGEATHGMLCHGATLDALLAVRGGGFGPAADAGLRSVADVAPTLRRLCGLPEVPSDGRDLRGAPHDTLVSESLHAFGVHRWGQSFAATDGNFTLVESGPRLELFDLRTDPGETAPLPLSHPAYEKLDRAMERLRGGPANVPDGELLASVSPYGELRRDELRYLPRHENARLADPRAHISSWSALAQGLPTLLLTGQVRRDPAPLREGLRLLEDFEREAPGTPWVDRHRAALLAALARVTGDRSYLTDAIRAELAAIEKGYVQKQSIQDAVARIVEASDPDALRALADLLRPRSLDRESAAALADATALLLGPAR